MKLPRSLQKGPQAAAEPLRFVADCLETIVEIGSEYQEIFEEHGGEEIVLVESCNTEETAVSGLAEWLRTHAA